MLHPLRLQQEQQQREREAAEKQRSMDARAIASTLLAHNASSSSAASSANSSSNASSATTPTRRPSIVGVVVASTNGNGNTSSGSSSSGSGGTGSTDTDRPLNGAIATPSSLPHGSAVPRTIVGSSSTPMSFAGHRMEVGGAAYSGLELSPGPTAGTSASAYELGSSYRDGLSPFGLASSYNDTLGGLNSFMSLNAPASPKRLSALELTFPSLEAYGYSDSDDESDPGPYGLSAPRLPKGRGRSRGRRGSTASAASSSTNNNNSRNANGRRDASIDSSSSDASRSPASASGKRHLRARHSSFAEYGDRPPPTSLAILAGLISGSARIIDTAYAQQGIPVPDIDDPGLPKSKYAKEPTELRITSEIYKAIEVCIEACHQLIGIVQRPEVTAAEAAYAFELSAALKVTTEAHVVEVLREEGTNGMHILTLAEKVGMEPQYLLRIMRLLVAHNIFLEMGTGSQWFANNRVSLRLDSKEPLSKVFAEPPFESPDGPRVEIRSLISHATDFTWNSASQMAERLEGKEIQQIQAHHPDEQRARLYRQLNARKCASYLGDPPNLVNVLRSLGNGLVVDLGSGLGRDLLGVAKAYPNLRIELHDKPEVIELAKEMWYRQSPRSVVTKAVTFVPHDLLGSMKYPRASTYLMRNHLVHWGDAEALTILTKARAAAFASSRLFVEESTSDDELPNDSSFLPQEMLDAIGDILDETSHNADRVQHLLDVAALLSGNGRKRTIIELVLLLEKAGWRTEKIDASSGGRCKIFICKPIKQPDPDDD